MQKQRRTASYSRLCPESAVLRQEIAEVENASVPDIIAVQSGKKARSELEC
jgi:hypothetical protein